MKSAIYEGIVRHVRLRPRRHALSLRVAMPYLDLDELDRLFDDDSRFASGRGAFASFDRRDHHSASAPSLADATRALVDQRLGFRPGGPVRLLTHLRYLGFGFNPVSFFYCFSPDEKLLAVVSEVNNTPWNERHCYVHDARGLEGRELRARFRKEFHVSPFMALDQEYEWRFRVPGDALAVRMTNHDAEGPLFHASMDLERRPWNRASRDRLLLRYPLLTVQVIAAIYAHAAILRLKGTAYVPHPDHPERRAARTTRVEKPIHVPPVPASTSGGIP